MHWRASQVFTVSEAKKLRLKKGFPSHSGHKTAAVIENTGKPDNGVFSPLLLPWLTWGAYWFLDGGMCIVLAPYLPGGVCGYAWYLINIWWCYNCWELHVHNVCITKLWDISSYFLYLHDFLLKLFSYRTDNFQFYFHLSNLIQTFQTDWVES